MERLFLTLLVVGFLLLCLLGMWRGWRSRARSQSVRVPPFPQRSQEQGEPVLAEAKGLYVSTTTAGHWQDRIVTRGAGMRSTAMWRLYPGGIDIDRIGAPGFRIPIESIVDVRIGKAIAGKVMGTDSLLLVTWRLGDTELETGFRGDDLDVYPQWIDKLRVLRGEAEQHNGNDVSEAKGGARG
jgi:hypothetical protein